MPRSYKQGSALLVVLWVIAFLSFLVITSFMVAMQDVETVSARQIVSRARQNAEAGLAIGVHPLVKAGDQVLHAKQSATESYDVNITSEEGRLNINSLLTEEKRVVLERLFESWGLVAPDAQAVVDCLMDWTDTDDFKRLNGAEKEDYKKDGFTDRPRNAPFLSLDEVGLVRGMDKVAEANPKWRDAFTIWGSGAIYINEASADLIAAMANVPLNAARTLVTTRNGADGIPHTPDDEPLQTMEEAMALLGAGGKQAEESTALFTLHGLTKRVESLGRVGSYTRRISVLLQGNVTDGASPIVEWTESAGE